MPANTPLCNWTIDETLEFMIDIGAVVQNDNGYSQAQLQAALGEAAASGREVLLSLSLLDPLHFYQKD